MKVFHVLWKVFHVCDEIHSYFWHTFSHATNMNVSRRTHELLSITHEILSSHMKYFHNTWISFITSYACISCVRRDTFIFVAWPIHTCGIRMCTVTHSHVYCESFVRILWLIRTCTVTHSYEYCDSFSTKRKFTRSDALGAWGCWSWVWGERDLGLKTSHGTQKHAAPQVSAQTAMPCKTSVYGVATIRRLLKMMSLLQKSPIKEIVFCERDLYF